jgi:hypothetical protein
MKTKGTKVIYILVGIAAIYGLYKLLKNMRAKKLAEGEASYSVPNLEAAQDYYNKIQQLYATAPSGESLPKDISDQVVKYMAEIEKTGFTIKDNQLVKQSYSS